MIIYKTLRNKQILIRNSQQGWMINMALNYQEKFEKGQRIHKTENKGNTQELNTYIGNKNEKKTQKGYKIHP